MRVLQVIHGYPMRYNAGSEVYTQGLAQALALRHEVHVFTRQENAFLPEYSTQRESDRSDARITLQLVPYEGVRYPRYRTSRQGPAHAGPLRSKVACKLLAVYYGMALGRRHMPPLNGYKGGPPSPGMWCTCRPGECDEEMVGRSGR